MAKTWVLDTDTKGTGARMVPLEDVLEKPEPKASPAAPARKPAAPAESRKRAAAAKPPRTVEKRSTPLPAGHVRKKATGEIGRVKAIDARAGTATVTWLRDGRTSTVPISSVTRK
jgi:hypothetical protein